MTNTTIETNEATVARFLAGFDVRIRDDLEVGRRAGELLDRLVHLGDLGVDRRALDSAADREFVEVDRIRSPLKIHALPGVVPEFAFGDVLDVATLVQHRQGLEDLEPRHPGHVDDPGHVPHSVGVPEDHPLDVAEL